MKPTLPIMRSALVVFLAAQAVLGQADDSLLFPLPDILRPNVEFWTRIYTDVSLNEGLLHDRDFPRCVYARVSLGQGTSRDRSRIVQERRDAVVESIDRIVNQPDSAWTAADRKILELMQSTMPADQIPAAAERVRFQQGQKDRFVAGLRRSGAYLDTIRAVFAQYGIPARVAYLPHVESSFDEDAYSKVGAAGLWQFMRSTGRLFLTINYLVDERRDPLMSTVAAAKLLRKNYDELGAWPIAITAYNHGLGGMKSAVNLTGSRDISVIIQKHTSRSFQFASKNFYSCFLAASAIAAHPEPYFGTVKMAPPIKVNEVVIDKYMSPSVISAYLKVPQDVLQKLNPALRPIVFQQQRAIPAGYCLRVPPEIAANAAMASLDKVPDSLKSSEPPRPKYYQVERGDNLYAIAARLGVTAQALAEENSIDRKNRIYAGQVLRVPAAPGVTMIAAATPRPAAEETLQALAEAETPTWVESQGPQGAETTPLTIAPSGPATPPAFPAVVTPTATGAPVAPPAIPPATARPATAPPAAAPAAQPATAKAPPAAPPARPARDTTRDVYAMTAAVLPDSVASSRQPIPSQFDVSIYNLDVNLAPAGDHAEIRVSVDETVGHYADWLGAGLQRVKDLNGMGRNSTIHINQRLSIPADKAAMDRFAAARLEYHMALEEDFYSQYKVVDVRSRPIARGENLWDLCNGEEPIPLWLFKKYNKHLDLSTLMPGMPVWIPTVAEKSSADADVTPPPAPGSIYKPYRESVRPMSRPVTPAP